METRELELDTFKIRERKPETVQGRGAHCFSKWSA